MGEKSPSLGVCTYFVGDTASQTVQGHEKSNERGAWQAAQTMRPSSFLLAPSDSGTSADSMWSCPLAFCHLLSFPKPDSMWRDTPLS